jgi:16S rRNA (guanine966-N2)-methyltransferase
MLKRRLFDWRQDWSGECFVDLCAGSGSMGLEALSRGASHVWLNEINKTAYRVLEKNVEQWKSQQGLIEQRLTITQLDFRKVLDKLHTSSEFASREVVIYFDPPYEQKDLYLDFWRASQGLDMEVWVESDELKGVKLAEQRQHLSSVVKEIAQGSHWVLVGRPGLALK